jgi:hypothetical protein
MAIAPVSSCTKICSRCSCDAKLVTSTSTTFFRLDGMDGVPRFKFGEVVWFGVAIRLAPSRPPLIRLRTARMGPN